MLGLEILNVARAIFIGGVNRMTWMGAKRHKFRAIPTVADGIRFPSKLEAKWYEHIKLKKLAGEVLFFLRQVPLHLSGGVRYVIDFVVFNVDGTCQFLEVKGYDTPMGKMKRKMAEAEYPITIEVLK